MAVSSAEFDFNLQGEQVQKLLLNPVFLDTVVEDIFDTMLMVNKRQQIGHVGPLDDILRAKTGCGFNPVGALDFYERTIDSDFVGADLELCFDEFKDTLYRQKLNKGVKISDMGGTVFLNVLMKRIVEGVQNHIAKLAFFGDKTAVDSAVNFVDGLWSVYIPALIANNLIQYTPSNSGSDLLPGEGIDLLQVVQEDASDALQEAPENQKFMLVSKNVYNRFVKDLQNGGISSVAHFESLQNGIKVPTLNGIKVIGQQKWQANALNYLGIDKANMVVYTTNSNLVLATDVENRKNNLDVWYDRESEKMKVKTALFLGFNYKHEDFLSVAI